MLDIFSERYSCRSYASDRVPSEDQISAIIEAARLAPSACNRQPWRFAVIGPDDAAGRAAVAAAYPREWVTTAPYYIVVCAVPTEAWVRPHDGKNHSDIDIAIATEHICLAAADAGLGTCWICHFDPARLTVDLALPQGTVPVVIVPVGYPEGGFGAPEKKRKPTDEILLKR